MSRVRGNNFSPQQAWDSALSPLAHERDPGDLPSDVSLVPGRWSGRDNQNLEASTLLSIHFPCLQMKKHVRSKASEVCRSDTHIALLMGKGQFSQHPCSAARVFCGKCSWGIRHSLSSPRVISETRAIFNACLGKTSFRKQIYYELPQRGHLSQIQTTGRGSEPGGRPRLRGPAVYLGD